MKLTLPLVARFAWERLVLPAIGRAIASGSNPLTKEGAKRAIEQAVQDEVLRRVG